MNFLLSNLPKDKFISTNPEVMRIELMTHKNSTSSLVSPDTTVSDYCRQFLNLLLPPLMWVLSSLSFFVPSARSPDGLSEINESYLVPMGFAFSIWFPIFVGCIAYGIIQAMGTNRTRRVFRKLGWWTIGGFGLICVWSLISAFAPAKYAQWGTALIFIPAMLCLVKAMLIATQEKQALDKLEKLSVHLPLGLIAGWTSLAVFLNWTPNVTSLLSDTVSPMPLNIVMLVFALVWAAFIIRKSQGNRAYAFPIIWGLFFLSLKQLVTEQQAPLVGIAAISGIFILIGVTAYKPKSDLSTYKDVA